MGTSSYTITVVVTPMGASPDQYAAITAIFAATLLALCAIWAVKQVLKLFSNSPES
jgi:hypothetical protein